MATPTVRKSGRIKTRKKSHFRDDDFEYEMVKFDLDVSHNISNLLHIHSKEKSDDPPEQSFESFPNIASTLLVKGKLGNGNLVKISANEGDSELPETSDKQPGLDHSALKFHDSEHQSNDNSEKKFTCNQCDKVFVELAAFKRHLRGHTGERPFKCDICEKSFTESCSLKRHMRTHEDERPFTCDICFKSFRDSTSFNRHQLTHTQRQRSFQCLSCDKNFTDKSGLKRHERTHSGLRPYQCAVCHKTFSESGSFRRHQKIHVGVRNYHCPRCKRSFMEKQSLIRHQKTVCGFWEAQDITDISHPETVASTSTLPDPGLENIGDNLVRSRPRSRSSKSDLSNVPPFTPTSDSGQQDSSHSHISSLVSLYTRAENNSLKGSPSLGSLIQKDPNLYDSISEIVDSIDSYEKMLDLCGDNGQKEIEAALTREPSALPENFMCFECGEVLVDGENFSSEGKSLLTKSYNSFRCSNCEEDEDTCGDPPVLTAEEDQKEESMSSRDEEDSMIMTNDKMDCDYSEEVMVHDTEEHVEDFKQHSYIEPMLHIDSDNHTQMNANPGSIDMASSTRNLRNYEQLGLIQTAENSIKAEEDNSLDHQPMPQLFPVKTAQIEDTTLWDSPLKNVDYEADDPNIPSVFPCHLCTKVFATSSFLEQHLELHRKSPHKCMVCGKSFRGSPALKQHMLIHTGEKPYACPICGKKFRDPSNFSKHKKYCSVNRFAPSPLDSASSTNSVGSVVSVEENLEDVNRNVEQEYLKLADGKEKKDSSKIMSQDVGESRQKFVEPMKVFPAYIDDFDEQSTESNLCLDEEKQEISYIPCEICQKLCASQQHLEMHMNYHRGNPEVTCIECGKSFSDCHGLKRHMRIHAESRPYTCEYCNRGYCDSWSLKKHRSRGCLNAEVQIPVDFLHPCPKCSRIFSEVEFLEEHLKNHKGGSKFECDICLKKFSEAFNLRRHRRLHMTICPGCGEEFKNISEMTEHQKNCSLSTPAAPSTQDSNDINNFPCPDCGRSYSTLAYLERHKKFHSDVKHFVCEICNKKFSEAFKLRRHKRVHSESKPFVCQECGKGFSDEAYLKRHTINSSCTISKTMRGAAAFPCQYCDKVFSKNYMLVRHMNVHSQERPFSCDICGRSYKDTSSLKRHQLVHQGFKQFICLVCGKAFYYADSLKRHMSGKCSKASKSRRLKSASLRRKNGVKMKLQDSVNNNNKNHKSDKKSRYQSDKTSLNYVLMKSNTTAKGKTRTLPYKSRILSDSIKIFPRAHQHSLTIKTGPWSCYSKNHCWRCDTKMPSADILKFHVKIHQHKKKFPCLQCFVRFSGKMYWKAHMAVCSLKRNFLKGRIGSKAKAKKREKRLTSASSNLSQVTNHQTIQRPRRSIPRTQWSWLTQI